MQSIVKFAPAVKGRQQEKQAKYSRCNEHQFHEAAKQNSPLTVATKFFLEISMCEHFLLFLNENLHK
jgi:hypothetical protein